MSLGVLLCGALLATGCHKKTQAPEPYAGASMISEERAIVTEVVPDSARREAILAILDQAESRLREFETTSAPQRKVADAVLVDHDATEEQIRSAWKVFEENQHETLRALVGFQAEIRQMMFPNEWAEIATRSNRLIMD
jgi:hypothetical protein